MSKDPKREILKELVERAKNGDALAYGRIFRLCYRGIYDYVIRRVGNQRDAEDLTMQVFLKGFDHIGSYEERGYTVNSWLFRIAHNLVVDHFRTQRETPEPIVPGREPTYLPLPEEEVIETEETKRLRDEIMQLPPAQAEVLVLRFIEGLGVAETARVLDKKEVTVRTLQFKGLKNLKKRMWEEEEEAGKTS